MPIIRSIRKSLRCFFISIFSCIEYLIHVSVTYHAVSVIDSDITSGFKIIEQLGEVLDLLCVFEISSSNAWSILSFFALIIKTMMFLCKHYRVQSDIDRNNESAHYSK